MAHAQKAEPKYREKDIHSTGYHFKPSAYDALYQKGVAPLHTESGVDIDKKLHKTQSHNDREEGKPQNYMGEPGEYGHGVVYHALPTKQATHNLRVAKKEGNVTYLQNWHKSIVTSDIDPNEQPMGDPIRYDSWRRAGEDNYPSKFSENRGYAMPHAVIGKSRTLAHGNSKDTPQSNLYVQDVTPDPNMDYNLIGNAISGATVIEPSGKHYALAKRLKYALPANDDGNTLEEKIHKEHQTTGIGHKVGEAGAEVVDFAMFVAGKH